MCVVAQKKDVDGRGRPGHDNLVLRSSLFFVMPGLGPGIHEFLFSRDISYV
jgi:hypothetical protein